MNLRNPSSLLGLFTMGLGLAVGCASEHLRHHDSREGQEADEDAGQEPEESDEKAITLSESPAPVQDAFRRIAGSAAATKVVREEEHGATEYEIDYKKEGRSCSLRTTPDGDVVEIEQEMGSSAMSATVMKALAHRFPDATVEHAEQVTEYHYSLRIVDHGKKRSIEVTPSGRVEESEESD